MTPISVTPPNSPYQFDDSVDGTHPMNLDFVLPMSVKPNFAKLSVKLRLYRTYSSLSLSGTGGQSATHSHAHSGTHSHTVPITSGTAGMAVTLDILGNLEASGGGSPATSSVSPGATDNNATDHTHSLSGSSILGVSESGAITTISAIAIDGTDVTAQCPATATTPAGGPWASDFVDLDLTALMPTGNGGWHYVSLTATGLGRLVAILRLG